MTPQPDPTKAETPANQPNESPRLPLSEILSEIAADPTREFITVSDLMTILGGRGQAALILLFAFPNVLPAPPGVSGILGIPLIYLSFQMMLAHAAWLPKIIGERGISHKRFARMVERLVSLLARAERFLRPRWQVFIGPSAERVLGGVCLILALVLALPIPLGNMLPALAICLIALGVLERDGLWAVAGVATGVLALAIVFSVVYALIKATIFLLLKGFS